MSKRPRPIVLTVLDGWGYRAETKGNAIALARKPAYDELLRKFPNTLIQTSGPFVGLPEGQMGNSEVGHMNIGAGGSGNCISWGCSAMAECIRTSIICSRCWRWPSSKK